ncbi:MAG TPA: MBL fold metallo-hydrolase [Pseudonocardia sp.]|uniref:MBL fold metallo-hydrolase n=1 Tax=Pseudonocardia sp. TaxID=60912 RepID=UPI002F3FF190
MYEVTSLLAGYPGTTRWHGGLGWSSVLPLQDGQRTALIDTGGPNLRPRLLAALRERSLAPDDVTGVLITHCHWDHVGNFNLFPAARITVGGQELAWARRQPAGVFDLADLHVEHLGSGRWPLTLADDGDEVLPGVTVLATPGHTPGHCAYRISTATGPVLFTGDAVKNRHELHTGEVALTLDEVASHASIERVRHELLADPAATLIPGHDVQTRLTPSGPRPLRPIRAEISAWVRDATAPTVFELDR